MRWTYGIYQMSTGTSSIRTALNMDNASHCTLHPFYSGRNRQTRFLSKRIDMISYYSFSYSIVLLS